MTMDRAGHSVRHISDKNYAILVTIIFVIPGAISASHHEMWRDEIQAWLLARDSSSVIELFRNLKYEGHPGLWHLCLMPLSRITRSPVIMQVFHLIIASAVVYVFTRFSPFPKYQRALFAFGYFPFFEYGIISRNYALGLLFLFICCALFKERFTRLPLIGVILFLLAHTHIHHLIITIAIGIGLSVEYLFTPKKHVVSGKRLGIYIGFLIIVLGIATSIIQLRPPADSGFAVGWHRDYNPTRLRNVFNTIAEVFNPIPRFALHFWNTNVLDPIPAASTVKLTLSGLMLLWAIILLIRKPISLLIYISGTIGLLTFFYIKHFGRMRYHGFLFILFIASLWLSYHCRDARRFRIGNGLSFCFRQYLNVTLTLILALHLIGGITTVGIDYFYTFSQGKAVANYIRESGKKDMMIVGDVDYAVSPIAGYLDSKIYYARGDRLGSFVIWDQRRAKGVSHENVLRKAKELADLNKQGILIVLNSQLRKGLVSQYPLSEIARFEKAVVSNEVYYLYLMETDLSKKNQ